MSCFIMKTESLALLADAIAKIHNYDFCYLGFSPDNSLYVELRDVNRYGHVDESAVFAKLYRLNDKAYCCRYKQQHNPEQIPEYDFKNLHSMVRHVQYIGAYVIEPWHYQLMKLLDCWLYQTDEDDTARDDFRLTIRDLRDVLCRFIVRSHKDYDMYPWG